jgi:ATP-dependent DNA helicase RecG
LKPTSSKRAAKAIIWPCPYRWRCNLVQARGEGKGRLWHLSAIAYRRPGQKTAYVRQRRFAPLQQEQMVLRYVEEHRRITRREGAELCRISPHQADRRLTRLTEERRIARHGSTKGAWYERRA